MIKDITLGQYYPGESILHNADPRTKIILAIAYMAAIFIISSFAGYISLIIFTLVCIVVSGIPLGYTLKGLKPVLLIIIFVMSINIFTIPGRILFEYGFIKITFEGLETSVKMALRLGLLIISMSLLTLTTKPILLTDGIEKLMKPIGILGIPVHDIAMMMTIALRFIPTLLEETDKIMKAQASRGADFDTGGLVKRAKSFIPVLIPLFISAFRRANELATAMESRCYRGSEGRTRMKKLKFTKKDLYISSAMAIYLILLLYMEFLM